MMLTEKPITILNHTRLAWLFEGMRAQVEGLVQDANPHPTEYGEAFDWWLFGWTYSQMAMLERN